MTTDSLTEALNTFNKVLDQVLKHPAGPRRWRAAHDLLWLNVSKRNKQIYGEVTADCKYIRDSVNKFGFVKGSEKGAIGNSDHTLREALQFPVGAFNVIVRADPNAFRLEENARKMFNEFKEYTTREVY